MMIADAGGLSSTFSGIKSEKKRRARFGKRQPVSFGIQHPEFISLMFESAASFFDNV
jgi:hypothetical protein